MSSDAIVEDHLAHYGILRKSGRYPWGSGENAPESTRNRDFLDAVQKLKNDGLSEKEIARGFGMTTTQLRNWKTIAVAQQRQEKIGQAERLKEKGYSNVAIGQRMGINESSVRALLAPGAKDRTDVLTSTVDMLKREVADKKYIDVGHGVEELLPLGLDTAAPIGISKEKLNAAVAYLQDQGYKIHYLRTPQAGTGFRTSRKVLTKGDVPYSEVYANRGNIKLISEHSPNQGRDFDQLRPPISISSRRIQVRYAEDGGAQADGVIYIRPGAKDLSLGESHYAQVRIAVDGTHYLKGMAVYKDDLPPGTDIVFNTSKDNTGRKKDAFKEFDKDIEGKIDQINPFGAEIKPGGQRGALNIINEEGDWDTWSKNLSSQVLSKQSPALAKTQLAMTYERRQIEFAQLKALTNPAVRKKLLETFADETDSSAVHLKAAALPSQATKVILPLKSMNPNQIYAPSFRDGQRVVLIRFPHAGTFEIPELTVNNRNREARKLLGSSTVDAVGIHHKVAERLSGADFDGDFVLAIPNDRKSIKTTNALEGLKGFDPIHSFPGYDGMPKVTTQRKNLEMGKVTNLIADMSLHGAGPEEMARAVRHSMVVIDSEKHNLDFRSSEKAHGIPQLKREYQGSARAGAATLITRAGAEKRVPQRKPRRASRGGPVDPVTGRRVYEPTGATYVTKKGEPKEVTTRTTRLADVDDAFSLIPKGREPHPVEVVYADHSNRLKAMANDARKEALHTRPMQVNKSAKATYAPEVASLDAQLSIARRNAPLERQAQSLADTIASQKIQARPDLDDSEKKKLRFQALEEARIRTGAHKTRIRPTAKEWEAIQAGAISNHKLKQILDNSDLKTIRQLATPRSALLMTSSKTTRAKAMLASGYTQAEVAQHLGVSLSTLKASL